MRALYCIMVMLIVGGCSCSHEKAVHHDERELRSFYEWIVDQWQDRLIQCGHIHVVQMKNNGMRSRKFLTCAAKRDQLVGRSVLQFQVFAPADEGPPYMELTKLVSMSINDVDLPCTIEDCGLVVKVSVYMNHLHKEYRRVVCEYEGAVAEVFVE